MTGRERVWAALVSTVMLAAVAWPAVRGSDGFPLSNYPMFSRPKDSIVQVYHVVAHSREGRHRPLPPAVLGTDEIMQAYQTVKFAIRNGESALLCERLAARLAEDPAYADVDRVEVRTDAFETVPYFSGDRTPRDSKVAAVCPVSSGDTA